jgi:hypothetical protein
MSKLPEIDEIALELIGTGMVERGIRAYNQRSDNCVEIASYLAERFGYTPLSRKSIKAKIDSINAEKLWGSDPKSARLCRSPACLIIRMSDSFYDAHVSFEFKGKEYNFGPSNTEGFIAGLRIPLARKSN